MVVAGPIANFILSIVIFAGMFIVLRQAGNAGPGRSGPAPRALLLPLAFSRVI